MMQVFLYSFLVYTGLCGLIIGFLYLDRDEESSNHWFKLSNLSWFWGCGLPVMMIAAFKSFDGNPQAWAIAQGVLFGTLTFSALVILRWANSRPVPANRISPVTTVTVGSDDGLYWRTWWSEVWSTALNRWQWLVFGTGALILLLWQGDARGFDLVFWAVYVAISVYVFRRPIRSALAYLNNQDTDSFTVELMGAEDETPALEYANEIRRVIRDIQDNYGTGFAYPDRWRVEPNPVPNSRLIGQTVFITTGAFKEKWHDALIAHEIGQLNAGTGRVVWALRQFSDPVLWSMGVDQSFAPVGSVIGNPHQVKISTSGITRTLQDQGTLTELMSRYGGLGVQVMKPYWSKWFRNNYYYADQMAVKFGYGEKLAQLLEKYKDIDLPEPYMFRFRPTAYHRLERLKS